jgi:hypothetical protein
MPSQTPESPFQRSEPAAREDRDAPSMDALFGIQVPDVTGGAADNGRGGVLENGANEDGVMDDKPHMLEEEELSAAERVVVVSRSPQGTRILRVVDARGYIARSVAIMGLVGVALIHLLDSGSKFAETPYIFWMYVGLMVASLAVAGLLLHTESWRAWAMVGGLAGTTILGFVLSRTAGLPGASKDVGNWSEPLGLASLFIEGCIVALALYRLFMMRRAHGDTP